MVLAFERNVPIREFSLLSIFRMSREAEIEVESSGLTQMTSPIQNLGLPRTKVLQHLHPRTLAVYSRRHSFVRNNLPASSCSNAASAFLMISSIFASFMHTPPGDQEMLTPSTAASASAFAFGRSFASAEYIQKKKSSSIIQPCSGWSS